MHHPTDRIIHTTAFVTPVVEHWLEREIAQWVHPMKDRSDDPSHHERTLLPRSYISLWYEECMMKNNILKGYKTQCKIKLSVIFIKIYNKNNIVFKNKKNKNLHNNNKNRNKQNKHSPTPTLT